jgi:hypothetical protein
LNYSTNDKDDKNSVNQKGEPFPPSMVDTTTFTMDWILGYQRSKEKYEELISYDYLRSSNAKKTMVDILRRFPYLRYSRAERYPCNRYVIAPWEISKGDIRHYHANFQFQFIPVGKSWEEAFSRLIKNAGLSRLPFPDDLEGALANFNFYAAINRVEYQRTSQTTAKCLITEVSVYMRDTYSFYDRSGAGSQYLGHWNKTGIRVVPEMNVIGANNIHWLMDTITIDGTVSEGTVFYPVYNKDFRDWQEQYRQGGDMLLFYEAKCRSCTGVGSRDDRGADHQLLAIRHRRYHSPGEEQRGMAVRTRLGKTPRVAVGTVRRHSLLARRQGARESARLRNAGVQ